MSNWSLGISFQRDRADEGVKWLFSGIGLFRNRTVTDEVLRTVIVDVESLLSGRPLTHVSADPNDLLPLTPNNFLISQVQAQIPAGLLKPEEMTSRRRWLAAQAIVDHFWRRWMREYVSSLIERRK